MPGPIMPRRLPAIVSSDVGHVAHWQPGARPRHDSDALAWQAQGPGPCQWPSGHTGPASHLLTACWKPDRWQLCAKGRQGLLAASHCPARLSMTDGWRRVALAGPWLLLPA